MQEQTRLNETVSPQQYLQAIMRAPVYDVAIITPLHSLNSLSARLANNLFLKREDRQPVHSFKIRGAYNMMSSLTQEQKQAGVVTASAGNHAQGVALSAKRLGIRAIIVMPRTTPEIKVKAVQYYGGITVLHGQNFDEAKQHAIELAKKEGYTMIPPFDHPAVIAGQGTLALELLQQNSHIDYLFIPVGGGGLAAGCAVFLKQIAPHIKIIGVEAEDSACLKAAMNAGKPVSLDRVGAFADGVAVKQIGTETFRLCQQYLDDVITVSSDEICAALKDIFEDTRAVAEPSGALSLAGLKRYSEEHQLTGFNMVAILSGANLNFHSLRYISERSELGEKREGLLAVSIPEQQGAFLNFCQVLGQRTVTEFNYRFSDREHKSHECKNVPANIFVGVRLNQGQIELDAIINELQQAGYAVADLTNDEIAKQHVRYMIGGKPSQSLNESLYSFEFPECVGALALFLETLGTRWNISLFNYRNQGADYGHVLCAFVIPDEEQIAFAQHLEALGYPCKNETETLGYQFFLK